MPLPKVVRFKRPRRRKGNYPRHPIALWQAAGKPSTIVVLCILAIAVLRGPWDDFSFDFLTFPGTDASAGNYAAVGQAVITDGDTIKVDGQRIRFYGIDAPESRQSCNANGTSYPCGKRSTAALKQLIGGNRVGCQEMNIDRYNRMVAICYVNGNDLNSAMVSHGWALAYRRYSTDYVAEEELARAARRGMWQGAFTAPWEWRRSQR